MSRRSRLNETTALQSPHLSQSPPLQNPPPFESLSSDPLPSEIAENVNQSEHSLAADDGAHLENIAADFSGEGGASLPQPSDVGAHDAVVPMASFIDGFVGGFNLAGNFVKSLAIMPEEDGKARAAAEAIYNTCLEVESLRFIIAPQGKWIGRGAAVLMFAGPKVVAARDELRARKAKALGSTAAVAAGAENPHLSPIDGQRDEERSTF